MLNRIRIQGYKSLRDIDVELKPLSVLFGPNAAGKSNFLDVLQLLSRVVSCHTLKDAFEPPYRGKPLESFSFHEKGLEGLLDEESLSFRVEVDFTLSDTIVNAVNRQVRELKRPPEAKREQEGKEARQTPVRERFLRYCIEIEMLPRSGILRVADEYLAALNRKVNPLASASPSCPAMTTGCICVSKDRPIPPIWTATSITASCRCRTTRHITRTWSRPVRRSAVGSASISSRANVCGPSIRSRRYGTSG